MRAPATTEQDRRVIVTDGEARAALAACRGLETAGYRVTAVAGEWPAASHWSRACWEQIAAPDPRVDRAAFAAALSEALAFGKYDVLLPGSDAALLAISEHRGRLGAVPTGLPDHEVVLRCLNKLGLIEAAPSAGFEVPRTERLRQSLRGSLRGWADRLPRRGQTLDLGRAGWPWNSAATQSPG